MSGGGGVEGELLEPKQVIIPATSHHPYSLLLLESDHPALLSPIVSY